MTDVLDQLVDGRLADPHSVLGAHTSNGGVVVRAFRPAAERVDRPAPAAMRRHGDRRCIRTACSRPSSTASSCRWTTSSRSAIPTATPSPCAIPYAFLPTLSDFDVYLAGEGRHEQLYDKLGAHEREFDGVTGTSFAVWAPAAADRQRRRRLQLLGRAAAPDALARLERHLGAVRPGRGRRRALQVRDPHAVGRGPPQGRSLRPGRRASAGDLVDRPSLAARVGRREVDDPPRGGRPARAARVDLRGPPRLLAAQPGRGQPLAELRRARRRAGRLREGHALHPRRAAAGDGAPVRRLLGLPGDLALRPHAALRLARRAQGAHRPAAPERHRRDPRLGPGALPQGRLGARALRRHRALRARRPAPRRASGVGDARVQLRPQRGPQLPRVERPVLARRVPRRRAAGGRGRLDALPRLLA